MSKFDSNIVTSYFYSVTEQVWLLVTLMDPMARTSFLSKDTIRFLRIPTQAPRIGRSEPEPASLVVVIDPSTSSRRTSRGHTGHQIILDCLAQCGPA